MRRRRPLSVLAVLSLSALAACGEEAQTGDSPSSVDTASTPTPESSGDTAPTTTESSLDTTPTPESSGDTTPISEGGITVPNTDGQDRPTNVGADDLAAAAVADLAERLGVGEDAISVVSIEEVTWPDGSIGCPEPGMAYTQALVNGSRVVVEYDGTEYAYHQGGRRTLFYCPADRVATTSTAPNPDV